MDAVVIASDEAEAQAAEAVEEHHAQLAGALALKVDALAAVARAGGPLDPEVRADLVVWCRDELVPHALAEERTLYAAAARRPEARLLVEAMLAEHRVIIGLVEDLERAADAVGAAVSAAALRAVFQVHLAKENDQVLPLLVGAPDVSLADLLGGMHELLGGHADEGHVSVDAAGRPTRTAAAAPVTPATAVRPTLRRPPCSTPAPSRTRSGTRPSSVLSTAYARAVAWSWSPRTTPSGCWPSSSGAHPAPSRSSTWSAGPTPGGFCWCARIVSAPMPDPRDARQMSGRREGDAWVVLGHAEVVAAATTGSAVQQDQHPSAIPNTLDGRRPCRSTAPVVDRYLTDERVANEEPQCRAHAAAIVDALPRGVTVRTVAHIGTPYAVRSQSSWLGWPATLEDELVQWIRDNHAATRSGDRNRMREVAERFDQMIRELLDTRRSAPTADVTSELLDDTVDGRPLTTEEIVSILRNWTAGDLGSLATSVGVLVRCLASDSDIQRQVRSLVAAGDRLALAAAAEEILRIDDPSCSTAGWRPGRSSWAARPSPRASRSC